MAKRGLWFLAVNVAFAILLLSCGSDDGPATPETNDGTQYAVGEDSSTVEHEDVVAEIPAGLFREGATIVLRTTEQPSQNPPPDGVTPLSDVLTMTVSSSAVADVPDSVALAAFVGITLPVTTSSNAYVRATVTVPGLASTMLYGLVQPAAGTSGAVHFGVPLALLAQSSAGSGDISVEMQVAASDASSKTSVEMQLYEVSLDASEELSFQEVDAAIEDLGSKRVVLVVHGWSISESSDQTASGQIDKLQDYWGAALEYLLTVASDEFAIYCIYYDEDNSLESLATEMKTRVSDRFDKATHGDLLILAHSMGGLLARAWVINEGGADMLAGAVFIDTPHHGCAVADAYLVGVGGPLMTSVWMPFLLLASGAQNITYDLALANPWGLGNDYLSQLNAAEESWGKYVCLGGDYGGAAHGAPFVSATLAQMHLWDFPGIGGFDGIVEMESQLPDDLSSDFTSYEHSFQHNEAKDDTEEVLPFALSKLREMRDEPDPPVPPVARFTVTPSWGTFETTFQFDASGSTDDDDLSFELQVRWDWENDGAWDTEYTTTKTATKQYDTAGEKTIVLQVLDTGDLTDDTSVDVVVGPGPDPGAMVEVPAGSFVMGDGEAYCGEDEHMVTLTRSFYLGQTEVTNQEYMEALQWAYDHDYVTADMFNVNDNMDGSWNELLYLAGDGCEMSFADEHFAVDTGKQDHPVKEVTWYGAARYCDWLSMQEGLARAYAHSGNWSCNGGDPYGAQGYRLPTDAEWEYAAQYDDERAYPWGNEEPTCARANFFDWPSGCVGWTSPVGSYPPAPAVLGLYDMVGNVYEWCNDWYTCSLGTAPRTDPAVLLAGTYRVIRGGAYNSPSLHCVSARRAYEYPEYYTFDHLGFRIARSASAGEPALVVSTHGLNFGAEDEQLTLVITNSGTGTLGWNISGNQPWIEVSPASGSTTTEPDDVAVTVNREGMDPGTHYGEVTVDAGAAGVETVDVEASVADATAPATVQDLSITSISEFTMQLTWEAPGDDGMEGQAESYDLRYSLTPLTEQNWESAQSVSPLPTPGPSGSRDATDVEGLFSLTTYHFGLKSTDDSGNESGLSNTVAGSTLPLEPVQLTFDGEYDYVCAPAWSPRGDLIAYESCRDDFRGNIWVVSSGGGSAVKLTEGADGGGRMPCWSPDGSWIAFVRDDDEHIERIWKVPVSGGHAIQVTEGGGGYHEMPAWSPDGSQIAYIDWVVGQGSQIFLVPSSGGSGAALEIAVALNPISLSWSPDGLSLAFTTVSCRLYAVSSAGGYARPVANGFASGPDWSSCGEWIAFSGEVEGASKTCVVHSEAYEGHSYSLTTDAFEYGQPSWSPDGSRLVVISDRSGIYQLWIIGFRLEPE